MASGALRHELRPPQNLQIFNPAPDAPASKFSRVVDSISEAMSIKYNTLVYELRRQGRNVIVMSLGEAYFDLPLFPFDDLPFPDIYHYSHSRGLPELREKLSAYYTQEYDVPVNPDSEMLITTGSKAAIYQALLAILNPGDEVLIPEPAWVSYTEQVKLCHAKPVGMHYDTSVEDIENYITPRTRAIIITTPHNPRGYVYSEQDLKHLLELARKHDLWLLSDETYSEFVNNDPFVSLGSLDPEKTNSIVFNSISKNYGISGWRLGYVIAQADLIYRILKINQHLITCPATILSHYVAKHFEEILSITKPQIQTLLGQRAELAAYMSEIGLEYLPGSAAYYFFVSLASSDLGSEDFCLRLLQDHAVSCVPGIGYGDTCDRFIRVSFGTASMEDNRLGLRKIKALIEATTSAQAVIGESANGRAG